MRLCLCTLPLAALLTSVVAAQKSDSEKAAAKDEPDRTAFTLENIFPDKKSPLFGPAPRAPAFSYDGQYAAWLHRGYDERRHGSDLWLLRSGSGDVERLTSATRMAAFQKSSRKVVDDRTKKNKEAKIEDKNLGDIVAKDDATAEKAPRYSGVSRFVWSPKANELLLTSEGDIYRLVIGQPQLERLTHTRERESDVHYLPGGDGYTYRRGGSLMRVRFGEHLQMQIDPKLGSGETMTSYRLSPDGHKLVFLSRKGSAAPSGGRTVNIASYSDRFMSVHKVSRRVSDDPLPASETRVYLLDLDDALAEKSKPVRVYTHKTSGPRDILEVPEWAPDSSRVTFAVFDQDSQQVIVLQAELPPPEVPPTDATAGKKSATAGTGGKTDKDAVGKGDKDAAGKDAAGKDDTKDEDIAEAPARVVYRFLHYGGPNTPSMMQPFYAADSRRIVFVSEQTGFRHVHLLDPLYESQQALTHGQFEVYPIEPSKDHRALYVAATKEGPSRQDIYALELTSGELKRLTNDRGVYSDAAVSPDGKTVLANFAAFGSPRELVFVRSYRSQKTLTHSHPAHTTKLTAVSPELFSYHNRHGHQIWGHVFKPKGWRKSDKRPLLLYVYGGPLGTRKQVTEGNFNAASYFFAQYMAREHGWVTCTIDPRGMSGYGGVFEKANFEQVGRPQVEDLVDGVHHMVAEYGVDDQRVAIHGWSFGGFQTQMCMYTEPDAFQVGIAGAGPTEWENYNSWYSTGTIGKSRTGKTDLKKYSLLPLAKNLKGKLLLVHGMEDSNVLYQDTVRVYRELLKADKETLVELFLDPTGNHGLNGDITNLRRYRKYEEFLLRTLDDGPKPRRTPPSISSGGAMSGK